MSSVDERVEKYGEVIWHTSRNDEGSISATGANNVARAVMAVADAEQTELRATLDAANACAERRLDKSIEWMERAEAAEAKVAKLITEVRRLRAAPKRRVSIMSERQECRRYCTSPGLSTSEWGHPGEVRRCEHGRLMLGYEVRGWVPAHWRYLNPILDPINYWSARRAIRAALKEPTP